MIMTHFQRLFSILSLTVASAGMLHAQFNIVVESNGQASGVANGGSLTLNAPAVGQTATAKVTFTFIGAGSVVFPGAAQVLGSTAFGDGNGAAAQTISSPFQSTSVTIVYSALSATANTAQFLWPFNQQVSRHGDRFRIDQPQSDRCGAQSRAGSSTLCRRFYSHIQRRIRAFRRYPLEFGQLGYFRRSECRERSGGHSTSSRSRAPDSPPRGFRCCP